MINLTGILQYDGSHRSASNCLLNLRLAVELLPHLTTSEAPANRRNAHKSIWNILELQIFWSVKKEPLELCYDVFTIVALFWCCCKCYFQSLLFDDNCVDIDFMLWRECYLYKMTTNNSIGLLIASLDLNQDKDLWIQVSTVAGWNHTQ